MLPVNDGQWIRGETLDVSLGAKLNFKTDFLAKARNMAAPEISHFIFQLTGTVSGVTATALGIDAAKIFSRLRIRDKDIRCDVSGAMMYALNEAEFGIVNRNRNPATVASAATNTSWEYRMVVPYEYPDADRERDYRIPVPYILEGGVIQATIAAASPTGFSAIASTDLDCTVWARVVENRKRELKSTLVHEQFTHSRQEDYFPINGSIRNLVACTDLTTTTYTSISTYTAVNSKALDLETDFDPRIWVEKFLTQKYAAGVITENIFGGALAWPILIGDRHQRIGAMPNIDQLDLRLQAAPVANSAIAVSKVVDRNPSLAAAWMGYASPAELAAAVEKWGHIVDDHNSRYVDFDPVLAARLPVRLRPERGR
jgi:hypothetical protein